MSMQRAFSPSDIHAEPEPDWAAQPEDLTCEHCGKAMAWVWGLKFTEYGWMRPNSHKSCQAIADMEAHREACLYASKRAGVPVKLRQYHPSHIEVQQEDTSDAMFIRWMARKPNTLGALTVNADAILYLSQWQPYANWLYLEGKHGRGKSLAAAALTNRLVWPASETEWFNPDGTPWVQGIDPWRPGHRRRAAPPTYQALYIDWPELDRRIKLSWSADRDPLNQVWKVRVLVLDDLPQQLSPNRAQLIEQLVCARYRDNLPTVITSNVPWYDVIDEDRPVWGHRVASRLAEVCKVQHLRGPNWRNPPDLPRTERQPKRLFTGGPE